MGNGNNFVFNFSGFFWLWYWYSNHIYKGKQGNNVKEGRNWPKWSFTATFTNYKTCQCFIRSDVCILNFKKRIIDLDILICSYITLFFQNRTDKEMMEAVLKSKTDLTAKQKKDVVDTFRNFDRNGNGSIPSSDLKVIELIMFNQ